MATSIIKGQSKLFTVPIKRFAGYSSPISFTPSVPLGISVVINPTTSTGSTDGSITVNITANMTADTGINTITLTGNPPAKNGTVSIVMNVFEPATTTLPPTTVTPTTTTTSPTPTTAAPTTTTTAAPISSTLDFNYVNTSGRFYNFTANGWVSQGSISKYSWTFGDGSIASGQSVSHYYYTNGNYNVTVSALLSNGQTITKTRTLYVNYIEPTTTAAPTTTTTTRAPTTTTTTTTTTTRYPLRITSISYYREYEEIEGPNGTKVISYWIVRPIVAYNEVTITDFVWGTSADNMTIRGDQAATLSGSYKGVTTFVTKDGYMTNESITF